MIEPLLEHTAAEILGLSQRRLRDRLAQGGVTDARLARRPGEPGRFEYSIMHGKR